MKRKRFSSDIKFKVAIEAIKGHKTTNELASEFEIHPTQINTWKKQLLESSGEIFGQSKQKQSADHEQEKEALYSQIGKLKVEIDWLKKKTGHLG
jgi:transposase